jgi:hypothetical protein
MTDISDFKTNKLDSGERENLESFLNDLEKLGEIAGCNSEFAWLDPDFNKKEFKALGTNTDALEDVMGELQDVIGSLQAQLDDLEKFRNTLD